MYDNESDVGNYLVTPSDFFVDKFPSIVVDKKLKVERIMRYETLGRGTLMKEEEKSFATILDELFHADPLPIAELYRLSDMPSLGNPDLCCRFTIKAADLH